MMKEAARGVGGEREGERPGKSLTGAAELVGLAIHHIKLNFRGQLRWGVGGNGSDACRGPGEMRSN